MTLSILAITHFMLLTLVGTNISQSIVTFSMATDEYYFIGFVPEAGSHNVRCVESEESSNCLSIWVPSYGP